MQSDNTGLASYTSMYFDTLKKELFQVIKLKKKPKQQQQQSNNKTKKWLVSQA